MIRKKVVVKENFGIHARPAAMIVGTCQKLASRVTFCKGCNKADGCSILEILLLSAEKGAEIEITVEGNDEDHAIQKLTDLFENGTGI